MEIGNIEGLINLRILRHILTSTILDKIVAKKTTPQCKTIPAPP